MPGQEEIIKQKEKRRKTLIIAVCIIAGMFLLLLLATFILESMAKNKQAQKLEDDNKSTWVFPEPDYDYDIFTDPVYASKTDISVRVQENGAETVITEENQGSYSLELQFMGKVINLIIYGKYEEYNQIFTEKYKKANGGSLREFTMQQLFNIILEPISYTENGNFAYTDIKVTYRIRNNNGTFRRDLDFDASFSLPVVYTLVKDMINKTIQVDNIVLHRDYASAR